MLLQAGHLPENDSSKFPLDLNSTRMQESDPIMPQTTAAKEASEIEVFDPSLLLDPSDSNMNQSTANNEEDHSEALEDLLQLLGPLTLSDPAFGLGVGATSRETPRNRKAKETKRSYLPPSLLRPHTFFSTTQLKLPPNTTSLAAKRPLNTSMPLLGAGNATTDNTNSSNFYDSYDPLAFLDEQANYTMQQVEAAQKTFLDYSVNASRQIDEAQKALLDYGTNYFAAQGLPAPSVLDSSSSSSSSNNKGALSVEELEAYLRRNGYVKQTDLGKNSAVDSMSQEVPTSMGVPISQFGRGRGRVLKGKGNAGVQAVSIVPTNAKAVGDAIASTAAISKQQQKGRVAFPQPSILSYTKLKWGATVAASFLGMLGGVTIFSNLWLLGAIFGGLYGYETAKNLAERPPSNALSNFVVYLGKELTKYYLKVFDFGSGMWFMYKTGQLSYEYWQKYAELDQQFAIQSKIDAWNAKFLKGKENFDRWEQDNEVGRKLLAGLRTAWLVEEAAFKKSLRKKKSRYRVVQWFYDGNRYVRKKIEFIYSQRGQTWRGIQDLAEGMRQELVDPSQWKSSIRPRIAAALAALTCVNLTGTLFAVSPVLLGAVAVVLGGVVWPTWFSECLSRLREFFEETKAKGRGEDLGQFLRKTLPGSSRNDLRSQPKARGSPRTPSPTLTWPFGDKNSKERYSYFRRSGGSKRWYRAGGNPWDVKSSLPNMFGQKKDEEARPWWSLN